MRAIGASFIVAMLLVGCSGVGWRADSQRVVTEDMDSTPLIERSILFGNPDRTNAQISPDGSRLAYLAEVDGVLNVWVGPTNDPSAARPVTRDTNRGVRSFGWAFNNRHILYIQDKGGDENWHIYATDLTTNDTRDLTPIDGVQARFQQGSHKFPNEMLIAINDRVPELHDIHRVNILTGERMLVQQNDGYLGFTTDDNFNVRLATKPTQDGGSEIYKRTEDGESWTLFMKVPAKDMLTTSPVGFDKAGETLYMRDSLGRNTAALVAHNLMTNETDVVASNRRCDVGGVMAHPTERTIQAVSFTYTRREWKTFDDAVKSDLAHLETLADGDVNVTSRTLDDRQWIVAFVMDNGPVRYYHYDRPTRTAKFLFTNRKALEGQPLAQMHPVVVKSRDGFNLVNYLSLPVWSDKDGNGRPEEPLPLVLMVHGGPWARDGWGYDPYAQWLTNRGYAMMTVNFRGSTGFGKDFLNAANYEWAGKMHDDLIDTVNWAIKKKIADPDRVAIMGGSYGGYATLVGLTFTPDVFACGVDIVGPSNLVTLLESIPPYWKPMLDVFVTRVGDHRTEEGRKLLTERSPLTYVDRISKPLLIGQGANDPRVKQAESDRIVQAMEGRSIPVTYILFPDEGHGFARPPNNMAFNAVAEAFLARHLGGRYEPIGNDFEDSTITAPKGASEVPGLVQALH